MLLDRGARRAAREGGHKGQYISLKPKGGKRRQESSNLANYQKAKKQGAFNVQITRDGCR
jgi:hypothetical protein